MDKLRQDKWEMNPPRVTSFLSFEVPSESFTSPVCGFGWRFRISRDGLRKKLSLWFSPHLCLGMRLSRFSIQTTLALLDGTYTRTSSPSEINMDSEVTLVKRFLEKSRPSSRYKLEITLWFNAEDGLAFPTSNTLSETSTPKIAKTGTSYEALYASLDRPSFADTKIYLYSAKDVDGRLCRPRALFGNSKLLSSSCKFFMELFSQDVFGSGVPCDLFDEDSDVTQRLADSEHGYESDSDLDSVLDEDAIGLGRSPEVVVEDEDIESTGPPTVGKQEAEYPPLPLSVSAAPLTVRKNCRAYAINGTAFKTLRAFIMYTYIGEFQFSPLRSSRRSKGLTAQINVSEVMKDDELDLVRCSPKSMYRFADYVGIPEVKERAKLGIKQELTEENIVTELFCSFTSKYQELIEMETEYLVEHFTDEVERAFDETLQMVVLGTKHHSYRALAFAMKRLRGVDAKRAWEIVDSTASG